MEKTHGFRADVGSRGLNRVALGNCRSRKTVPADSCWVNSSPSPGSGIGLGSISGGPVNEFYKKECQEKSSSSTGGREDFSLEIQPTSM
jgi:hypothetical protein